ncbi:MAG: glycosyl hydrolase [Nibricoccus sp.]
MALDDEQCFRKAGITKDLEWMQRSGLGGFMLADVNYGRGQVVDPKTPFGTAEWFAAVRHAAAEADRLGLEMSIFSSPGWSETGGPWVKPEQAMKKLVWSETRVGGPAQFSGQLAAPPGEHRPDPQHGRRATTHPIRGETVSMRTARSSLIAHRRARARRRRRGRW